MQAMTPSAIFEFDFVGFLDADITFHTGYYEELLAIFLANPRLGVAAGDVLERRSGRFQRRFGNTEDDVPGAIQFFRRRCYEDIGSQLTPLLYLRQEQLGRIRRGMRVPKRGISNPRKNAA